MSDQAASTPLTDDDKPNEWDTIFAIRYAQVNDAIVSGGGTPPELNYGDGEYLIKAPFKPWQVVKGGNGHLIQMHLPFTDLHLTKPGPDTADYGSGYFVIKCELKTVTKAQQSADPDDGTLVDFMIDFSDSMPGRDEEESEERGAVLDVVFDGEPAPSPKDIRLLRTAMRLWLKDHEADFAHVFATVCLGSTSDVEGLQWLSPTTTAYACTNPKDPKDDGIFAVLCMTERRPPKADRIVSNDVIPSGEEAAFVLSRERFLKKLMIGGMGYMFSGPAKNDPNKKWPEDYFTLGLENTVIQNNAALRIDNVQLGAEGDEGLYNCTLPKKGLEVTLTKSHFKVQILKLTHPYYKKLGNWWLDVEHTIECDYVLRVNPETQVLDLTIQPNPTEDDKLHPPGRHRVFAHKTKIAEAIEWAMIIVGIVLAFAPIVRWCKGWLTTTTSEVVEGVDTATQWTEMEFMGDATAEQVTLLDEEGADTGYFLLNDEPVALEAVSNTHRMMARSTLLFLMSGGVKAFADYLEAAGSEGSQDQLPKYPEFAARVLKPVTWPNKRTHFTVKDVQINDSFQTFGHWEPGE